MRIGSLCAGYGGWELGLDLFGVDPEVVWFSETGEQVAEVFTTRWGGPPNLGDLRTLIDQDLEPVDVICAGVPCQPFSAAGARAGTDDERWLVDLVAPIARKAQARVVLFENVPGILSASGGTAFADVVHSLAHNGFDAVWTTVCASEAGAPFLRERWWLLGWDTQAGPGVVADTLCRRSNAEHGVREGDARRWGPGRSPVVPTGPQMAFPADPHPDSARSVRTNTTGDTQNTAGYDFEDYQPAIRRWESVLNRRAPAALAMDPIRGNWDLNPMFAEWYMGLPAGWVTEKVADPRHSKQHFGNGIVPMQAALAVHRLIGML